MKYEIKINVYMTLIQTPLSQCVALRKT